MFVKKYTPCDKIVIPSLKDPFQTQNKYNQLTNINLKVIYTTLNIYNYRDYLKKTEKTIYAIIDCNKQYS